MQYLERPLASMRAFGRAIANIDRILLVSLLLTITFSIEGINWGRVECWNPDEVALRSIFKKNKPPFEPATFTKPPFHTYLTYFTVLQGVHVLEGWGKKEQKYFEHSTNYNAEKNRFNDVVLLGARFLTLTLYLGSVLLAFAIAYQFWGLVAARITALFMATSAGFIAVNHFLTADSPMLFWMLLAFFFAQRILTKGTWPPYLLAGLFVGLATATKYNALAVGMAIPVAHWLRSTNLKQALFSPRMILGVLMVPTGFILGCPYAVLDHKNFVKDFMYNYTVAPKYGGQVSGHSYGDFIARMTEILGWPGAIWVALAVAASLIVVIIGKRPALSVKGFVLAASVILLYYLKIGAFARIETRFVLPVVPFLLLIIGPALELCARKPVLIYLSLIPVLTYNCICSFYVGIRFADDPRMAAQTWVRSHITNGSSIESTQFCSDWNRIPYMHLDVRHAPDSNERAALFAKVFSNNPWVSNSLAEREGIVDPANFTLTALQTRNPQYVAIDSLVYGALSPSPVKAYFDDLLAGHYPYRILFDLSSPPDPVWMYPRKIDFLQNRITILQRIGGKNTPSQQPESDDSD
jgi:hypothetical protein